MSRIFFRIGMGLLALAVFAVQANVAPAEDKDEVEREVTLKEVPAKVKATILKAAGKNELKEVEEVVLKLFEAEWTKGDREIEVFITPDGKVLMKKVEKEGDEEEDEADEKEEKVEKKTAEEDGEVEEKEIGFDDLSAKVKAAVKKLTGKNEVKLEQLRVKFYEAMWMHEGKEVEILVTFDGKLVKPERDKPKKEGKIKAGKKGKDKEGDDDDDEKEDKD